MSIYLKVVPIQALKQWHLKLRYPYKDTELYCLYRNSPFTLDGKNIYMVDKYVWWYLKWNKLILFIYIFRIIKNINKARNDRKNIIIFRISKLKQMLFINATTSFHGKAYLKNEVIFHKREKKMKIIRINWGNVKLMS